MLAAAKYCPHRVALVAEVMSTIRFGLVRARAPGRADSGVVELESVG
jgi:hypothetical protein